MIHHRSGIRGRQQHHLAPIRHAPSPFGSRRNSGPREASASFMIAVADCPAAQSMAHRGFGNDPLGGHVRPAWGRSSNGCPTRQGWRGRAAGVDHQARKLATVRSSGGFRARIRRPRTRLARRRRVAPNRRYPRCGEPLACGGCGVDMSFTSEAMRPDGWRAAGPDLPRGNIPTSYAGVRGCAGKKPVDPFRLLPCGSAKLSRRSV